MFNVQQLRELIIQPALEDLRLYSPDAVELLVFTCAVESNGGDFLKQINGPALGIYQMEPETYYDIWQNYLMSKASLYLKLVTNFDVNRMPDDYRLIYDLRFATAMTRILYARVSEALPPKQDLSSVWDYYKKYYNTSRGRASKEQSIDKYLAFTHQH